MNWRHGLAQTRASWRRLVGAAVAIALGAAFVTATLLTAAMVREASDALVSRAVGGADALVYPIQPDPASINLEAVPAATSAEIALGIDVALDTSAGVRTSFAGSYVDPGTMQIVEGTAPASDSEIALPTTLADQTGVTVGSTINVNALVTTGDRAVPTGSPVEVTVSALTATSQSMVATPVVMTAAGITRIADAGGRSPVVLAVLFTTDDIGALEQEVSQSGWAVDTLTRPELANMMIGGYTGSTSTITNFALALVAIALVVSALVVTTTFQVLIAQRVTVLGLLRTAGATRRQIALSVLVEALALGVAGGIAGVLLGHLLAAVLVLVAKRVDLPVEMGGSLPIAPEAVILPIVVAMVVTLASVLRPAVEASRVLPLAAVRAATSPRPRRAPVAFGIVLVAIGAASAAAIAVLTRSMQLSMGYIGDTTPVIFALGVGLAAMIAGLTMVTPALFPRLNDLLGRAALALAPRRQRPTALLARRALATNRRRAIGTSNALLIGVTLVAMLGTGAASARASMMTVAAGVMPTDIVVESWSPDTSLPPGMVDELRSLPGVSGVAPMTTTIVSIGQGQSSYETMLSAVDPAELATASYDPGLAEQIRDGVILASNQMPLVGGQVSSVRSAVWPVATDPTQPVEPVYGDPVTLEVQTTESLQWEAWTTPPTMRQILPDAPITRVWITAPGADLDEVAREVERIATITDEYGNPLTGVYTPGKDRASTDETISQVVALATSLLAISILIALLGVANTLSLSVVERRREFAMLRSVGMTARQVRNSLALEGLVMALSAALVGIAVGIGFGLAGSAVLFPQGTSNLAVPWPLMVGIVVVAMIAGPIAAILPGRLATRGSPIEGLAS